MKPALKSRLRVASYHALLLCGSMLMACACQAGTAEGHMPANHLMHETSPYLQQHARNPVDWYPWGEAAFEKARHEDKPVLLSIGYSTCHWCHIMEEESFSDPEVGRVLNESFVAIKVDREERPDIDQVYMRAAQMMTGSGGWPLNIMMTPDKRPFFAATYLPRRSRFGRIGLIELVRRVHELWMHDRTRLLESTDQLVAALKQLNGTDAGPVRLSPNIIDRTFEELSRSYDGAHGGFGQAPKFPGPHKLLFLLRYWHQTGEQRALDMVEKTLTAMREGGIFDQLGFGFHRYATDARWLLPHFEKMLYDQAMLVTAYAEAFQATGKQAYGETARDVVSYVLRDMRAPDGAFYSAEDADSGGEEGRYYIWTEREFEDVLGGEDAHFAARVFGLTPDGNVRDETTGMKAGANVLYLASAPTSHADKLRMAHACRKLLAAREQRARPFRDDKILTDWNGMMIAALAIAARALHMPEYAQAAGQAADFILRHLRRKDGRLWHRYRDGNAGLEAHLDDYAFLVWGLLELYETGFETKYLQAALALNGTMLAHFRAPDGGLYFAADDAEGLLVRLKDGGDGAIPSGNSIAMMNLIRLAHLTGNMDLEQRAFAIVRAFSGAVAHMPSAFAHMMSAFMYAEHHGYEVLLAGDRDSPGGRAMLRAVRRHYMPNKVVLWQSAELEKLAPYTKGQTAMGGRVTAYVCEHFRCNRPVTDPGQLLALLDTP